MINWVFSFESTKRDGFQLCRKFDVGAKFSVEVEALQDGVQMSAKLCEVAIIENQTKSVILYSLLMLRQRFKQTFVGERLWLD